MSEKNNNNDQFENLFQRNEAEFDIPYNEDDWLKLEKKLDLRDAKIGYRRKIALTAAAALFIISFLGYFTYENYVNVNKLNRPLDDQITSNDSAPDNIGSREGIDTDQTEEGQSNLPNVTEAPEFDENSQQELSDRSSLNEPDEPSATAADDRPGLFNDENLERSGVSPCRDCMRSEISNRAITSSLMQSGSDPNSIVKMSQVQRVAQLQLPHHQIQEDEQPLNGASGFTFSLKAAPDLSTVDGFSNFQSPGYSVGLDIGYQLNDYVSVSTGISRSVVRYRGSEGGYSPPVYLTGGLEPNQVTGKCILLDIPLTMKFNVLEFSQSRIFATAGVSSYIMLNEMYEFSYGNSYGDVPSYSYEENTGTAHLMSNAGISIGIEVDIHPNWSLRAEPQIKLPLREVGVSNVRLYSLGSFFSLSYKL